MRKGVGMFQFPVGKVDMLHKGLFNQTHNVYLRYIHYARTFTVLGYMLKIKDTSMVRIIGRVW